MKNTKKSIDFTFKISLMAILMPFIVCFSKNTSDTILTAQKQKIEVNIFIHGVCNIEGHLNSFHSIMNFFKDDIYNTYYQHSLALFRNERSFYQFQAMQDLGMHEINDLSMTSGNASGALVSVIDSTFSLICPKKQLQQRYYTYGWSGLHSVKEYRTQGKNFYNDIIALKKELSDQGYDPYMRIWGYSHGGNVALMMAYDYQPTQSCIDELILLGTPFISGATVEFVASPLFKKVYNIYSLSDKVQRYDLIHLDAFLCEQKLTTKTLKTLPSNLIQVRLRYTVPSKQAQRNKKSFAHSQNFAKQSIINGKSRLLKNVSPGHIELWLFGWTFNHYRSDYITYPIPAGAFSIPYALCYLDDIMQDADHNPAQEFIIDVRPYHELVLINQKTKKNGTINKMIAPFFTNHDFAALKEKIKSYNPLDLSYESYCQKVAEIDQQALATFNNGSNVA